MTQTPWLSVALLGVAIAGYAWLMPKKTAAQPQQGYVSEEAYSLLLEELEAENRELVDAVAQFKQEQDETVRRLHSKVTEMELQMRAWMAQPAAAAAAPVQDQAAAASARPPVQPATPAELPPTSIRGRYPELLAMHEKGRSIEQIAKSLGMNKGEVMLIIQLARKEEERHA